MVSIVVVYNNANAFGEFLFSLKKQSVFDASDVVGVDNTNRRFPSAAAALNFGAAQAKGDVLVFSHQDIEFLAEDVLERFSQFIGDAPDALVGVAGYGIENREKYSTIVHGNDRDRVGLWRGNASEAIEAPDECFFGMKKAVWDKYRFDEALCDNWHLYAVELALRTRADGLACLCVPAAIWHKSTGNMNADFYKGVKKLIARYKKQYPYLYTTCVQIRNTNAGLALFRFRKKMGRIYYRIIGGIKR